jgi:hypothetical protein
MVSSIEISDGPPLSPERVATTRNPETLVSML